LQRSVDHRSLPSFPTRRSSDLSAHARSSTVTSTLQLESSVAQRIARLTAALGDPFGEDPRLAPYKTSLDDAERGQSHLRRRRLRSEEHTSELQSLTNLVCRLLL